ncbi:MAG: nucleotidyltransferase domain-containing protein [Persephonella sp.]|nr:MAG: nucleotidyltransferase domain-containing protein [Persephonella sp.]RUM60611.1 MAG: nucleotidyltransferase domain-containing protein [Persephonella sp.]
MKNIYFGSEKVNRYISLIVEELKKYNPKKIVIFDSRARGDYKKQSDIDIAVDLNLSFREKRKLKEKIDRLSGLYSVDVVFLPDIDEDFKEKIMKEGKILYEKK